MYLNLPSKSNTELHGEVYERSESPKDMYLSCIKKEPCTELLLFELLTPIITSHAVSDSDSCSPCSPKYWLLNNGVERLITTYI